ncbi:flagellar motor switch protein FliM [Sphingosinicella sp. BN140058]|nr:flagellar motor switch protein FliM [Sphingosinicella sp. BN140058]
MSEAQDINADPATDEAAIEDALDFARGAAEPEFIDDVAVAAGPAADFEEIPLPGDEPAADFEEIPLPGDEPTAAFEEIPLPGDQPTAAFEEIPLPGERSSSDFEEIPLPGAARSAAFEEIPLPGAGPSDDFDDFDLPEPPIASLDSDSPFDQADIDALFGFDSAMSAPKKSGLRAVIESKVINHERLPMLEVVCERMIRVFATSMRNLTSDAIDVSLEDITSVRFGDFMSRVALPAMIGVFNVREWENYGVMTVESSLIYAVVDALLGGRRGNDTIRIEGRGFTTIETNLVSKMLVLALQDFGAAFEPITPVTIDLERIETSPRFAAIAGPTNICAVATFRVDMEGRGGKFSLLLPYATMEPVRDKLLQRFMGEKLGRDRMWEDHMASEIRQTEVSVDVVLGEQVLALRDVMNLEVGQTLALASGPDDPLEVHCGGVPLGRAHIGQRNNSIAVRILNDISKGLPK